MQQAYMVVDVEYATLLICIYYAAAAAAAAD